MNQPTEGQPAAHTQPAATEHLEEVKEAVQDAVEEALHEGAEGGMPAAPRAARPLNIFFDVDNTLIMWNGALRQHTHHVFRSLKEAGHTIYVWSGVGIRRWDMRHHNLDEYVTDYFIKPLEDHHNKLAVLGVPLVPDFVIDDHGSVVEAFGGYHIPDIAAADDTELLKVLDLINELAAQPTLGDVEEPGSEPAG